jgi:hypothetical protein
MAVATAVFTQSPYPQGYDFTSRRGIYYGPIVVTASPATYPKGGIPITVALPGFNPGLSNPRVKSGFIETRGGSGYIYFWTAADLWAATTVYAVGQAIQDPNGNIQVVTTGGTSGSTQPAWALPTSTTPNPTTTDGSVVWTLLQPSLGLLQIFQSAGSAAPLVELAQAATIPAGVSGDTIAAKLEFIKG